MKEQITYDIFDKVDIRLGTVLSVKKNGVSTFRVFDGNKERVNLFGTIKAKKTNGKKPIILSGHTDVVPVSKGWSSDPFVATVKGNKLYGR